MKVTLDEQPVEIERPTIAEGLGRAIALAEERGRVVIEATLDGCPLTEDQLAEPPETEMPGSELRLVSANPKALVRTTLYDTADALSESIATHKRAAEMIESGRSEEAMDDLSEALSVWQAARDVVDQGGELLGEPFAATRAGAPLAQNITRLAECLSEVKRCLAVQDWAALSDVLAFDMDELAQSWKRQLIDLADQLKPAAS